MPHAHIMPILSQWRNPNMIYNLTCMSSCGILWKNMAMKKLLIQLVNIHALHSILIDILPVDIMRTIWLNILSSSTDNVDIETNRMKFPLVKTDSITFLILNVFVSWTPPPPNLANYKLLALHYCSYYLIINLYINSLFLTSESPPNAPIMIAKR